MPNDGTYTFDLSALVNRATVSNTYEQTLTLTT